MSGTILIDDELFDGGPPLRVQRSLGLVKPGEPRIARRVELAILIGWTPLVALVAAQELVLQDGSTKSFINDFAVHARFLIAAPLFILAESDCIPWLGSVSRHFLDAGLVRGADLARFNDAVASTRRLLDSTAAELITTILAYALVAVLILNAAPSELPAWHRSGGGGFPKFSLAGWWHALVSLPLLLVLFLGWLWRVVLWWRFLILMARLDLRLVAGHPDQVGGLRFVSTSLRAFRLLSFAFGTIVAGMVANRIVHQGASPLAFKTVVIELVVFILILFAGPLTVFIRKLRSAKQRGIFQYGALAGDVGRQLEKKWLKRANGADDGALGTTDFSTTVDLYGIAANVYEMKELPFGLKELGFLIATALLPFVPVALMAIPLKEIIDHLAKLLM